jgi:hypothetical protein
MQETNVNKGKHENVARTWLMCIIAVAFIQLTFWSSSTENCGIEAFNKGSDCDNCLFFQPGNRVVP